MWFRVFAKYPENTFDAGLTSDDDLDVGSLVKTGARIDRLALGENALNGIYGGQALGLKDAVQPANYCTIKVAAESVCTVCGQRKSTGRGAAGQALVCYSYPFDAGGRGQIEAQPKFKDRANYERLLDTGRLPAGSLLRKIQTSPRIGLPEVNSWAEPIILVIARAERVAHEEPLSHVAVAAMVTKNERGRETVQGLTVILGEFARFGIDAFGDQDLSRGLAGLSCTLCEG
jgi:hypothetical protein